MNDLVPILRSFDERLASRFYIDYLGGEELFRHRFDETAPLYLGLTLCGFEIHLSEHHGDATPGSAIRLKVTNLDTLYRTLQQNFYRNARPSIIDQPWARDLPILDPFGNRIIFSEPLVPG